MWSYWVQKISVWAVVVLALVMAPIITMQIIDGDLFTLSLYVAIIIGIAFILQSVTRQWIYIVCLLPIITTINFLPLKFSFFDLSVLMVGGHFIAEQVVIKHRGLRVGNPLVMGCILVIAGILFYHWFRQGTGFKILGGEAVGARKNFSAVLGCAAYFLVVTLGKGQWHMLNRVPLWYFLTGLLFLIPFVLTTYFPAAAPYIYRFISNVNTEAYQETLFNTDGFGRMGQLGPFACGLATFLISQYPFRCWWRPGRWWVALLFVLAFMLCLRGGFRNTVFTFVCITAVGTYLSIGIKSLWMGLLGVLVAGILTVGHGTLFNLPLAMQRSISFVPGHWDAMVVNSTESSNGFRQAIQDIYIQEYLYKSPLIGKGFNYDRSVLHGLEYGGGVRAYDMTDYDFHKGFIMRKDPHIGWISLHDSVGLIGGGVFIILFLANCYFLYRSYRCYPRDQMPPIFIWTTVMIISWTASFFAVSGAFQLMLPRMCILSALTWLIYEHARDSCLMDVATAGGGMKERLP
jgi:hypothetical protein